MVQWDAQDYRRNSSAQSQWAGELLQKIPLIGTERILDLGCGDGKVTLLLRDKVPNGSVVGIDNSLQMIELAQKTFPSSQYPNLTFIRQDIRELAFDREFDLIFSNAVLHWIKDHSLILLRIAKALRENGKICFQMGGRGNASEIFEIIDSMICSPPWKEYFPNFEFPYGFYDVSTYQSWLNQAGLKPIRIELIPKDMIHTEDGLKGWIRTTWLPYLQQIPSSLHEKFISQIISMYKLKYLPDDAGKLHIKMMRLEVVAQKS